ncbi:MAG: hypothetical protein Q9224_004838 [Gallowayella concinna]
MVMRFNKEERSTQPSRAIPRTTINEHIFSEVMLDERTIHQSFNHDWTSVFIPSAPIYPLEIGAQILGKFYGGLARNAGSAWTAVATTNSFDISYGTIKLYFWSLDVRIGWDFVEGLANKMLDQLQRGFVGLFDAIFVHLVTGVEVHVKLIIKGKGGY